MPQATLQVSSTLAALTQETNATVAEFGVDDAYEIIKSDLDFYNEEVNNELLPEMCVVSDEREWVYGGEGEMTVEEIDEYGDPDVESVGAGETMAAPLRRYGRAIGWTADYMAAVTAAEFAKQYLALQTADLKGIRRNFRKAIFNPFDDLTYRDKLIDKKKNLKIYTFANGRDMPYPIGPNGEHFDEHNHFLASATLTNAAVRGLYETIVEHEPKGRVVINIPRGLEDTFRTLSDFTAFTKVNIVQPNSVRYIQPTADNDYDETHLWDREIGEFKDAIVRVKPWIFSGYIHAIDLGDADNKAVRMRVRKNRLWADFGLRAKHVIHPLYADSLARDYGMTANDPLMSAVLYIGGTDYVVPAGL